MKAHSANIINAIALMILGLWDYLATQTLASTNMIPVAGGLLLLLFYDGIKREDKVTAHIVVIITLLVFLSLIKPFTEALGDSATGATIRFLLMMLTSLLAIVYFIKSFIDARKGRKLST
jgi:uncharacterized membrane protein